MSAPATPPGLPADLAAAIDAAKRAPGDIGALLDLGSLMHDYGQHEQAAKLRSLVTAMLVDGIRSGRVTPDLTVHVLQRLYSGFVKKIETEEHARTCFQSWIAPVAAYGRTLQEPGLPLPLWQPTAERPWRVAFLLTSAEVLGHTQAMLELLRNRPRGLPWHEAPLVYNLGPGSEKLDALVRETGCEIVNIRDHTPEPHYFSVLAKWLRRHMADTGVSHFVWVSSPALVPFAMAMRLAPVQVFWTLKFHPFRIPEIDSYITLGNWGETERFVHGERWEPFFLAICDVLQDVDPQAVAQVRRQFAQHPLLFGVLARDEKMNSESYLRMVVAILRQTPDAGFIFAGRKAPPFVTRYFAEAGVAERCHFVGWVDTSVYVRAIDIFLETFPFGCGITGMQALAAGTPFLSRLSSDTQYGLQFGRLVEAGGEAARKVRGMIAPEDGRAPLGFVETEADYVAMAQRLAEDAGFRRAVGEAGRHHYQTYMSDGGAMGRRFFGILERARPPAD